MSNSLRDVFARRSGWLPSPVSCRLVLPLLLMCPLLSLPAEASSVQSDSEYAGYLKRSADPVRSKDVSLRKGSRAALPQTPPGFQPIDRLLSLFPAQHSDKNTSRIESLSPSEVPAFTLEPHSWYSFGAYTYQRSVVAGDFNGDKKDDLAVSDDSGQIFVFIHGSDGELQAPESYAITNGHGVADGLIAADLNGDGRDDLVVGQYDAISVFLAKPGGGFDYESISVPFGSYSAVALADINRDGRPDLFIHSFSDGASQLLNRGDGTFVAATAVPSAAVSVIDAESGDVTGDGLSDIVVSTNVGAVWVFAQLAGGGLAPARRYMASKADLRSAYLAIGDFNNDHLADVAAPLNSNGPAYLSLLLQGASGELLPPRYQATYDLAESTVAADMNGDGLADVVTLHGGWDEVGIYFQSAVDGVLENEVLYDMPLPNTSGPGGLAVGHFDASSCPGVAALDATSHLVIYGGVNCSPVGGVTPPAAPFIGDAVAGNATATVSFSQPPSDGGSEITGYTVSSIPAGGVDQDAGKPGFRHTMTGLANGTEYRFYARATNARGIGPASGNSTAVTPSAITVSVDDISVAEGATGTRTPIKIHFRLSEPSASTTYVQLISHDFSATKGSDYDSPFSGVSIAPGSTETWLDAEVIGDDTPEPDESFVVSITQATGAAIGRATGYVTIKNDDGPQTSSRFLLQQAYAYLPGDAQVSAVAIGDLSGDGRNDVALVTTTAFVGNEDREKLLLFVQQPDGSMAEPVKYQVETNPFWNTGADIALGDLNHDGFLDAVVAHGSGLSFFFGTGHGALVSRYDVTDTASSRVRLLDIDNDGNLDVLASSAYLLDSKGRVIGSYSPFKEFTGYTNFEIGDVTGDGLPDVVLLCANKIIVLPYKAGGGLGAAKEYYASFDGWSLTGIAIGDFNNDGRMDVATAVNKNAPTYVVEFLQTADGGLTGPLTIQSGDVPSALASGDLNGDGLTDLATLHSGWRAIGLYLQQPGAGLQNETILTSAPNDDFGRDLLAIGDLNGDGCPDLAEASNKNGLVLYYGRNCSLPPSAPLIGAATAGNGFATVEFSAPSQSGGSPIVGYKVLAHPADGVDVDAGSAALAHTITGLTNGRTYYFTVVASNAAGAGAESAPSNSVTPSGSTSPSIAVTGASTVEGDLGSHVVPISLHLSSPAPTGGVKFNLTTSNGSASAGSDYVSLSLSGAAIPAGASDFTVNLVILGDLSVEGDETLTVSISGVTGATVSRGSATVTIRNDDGPSPVARADSFVLGVNQAATPSPVTGVLSNDADPAGLDLQASVVTNPIHGDLWLLPDGEFYYTPGSGYVGTDSFTYAACNTARRCSNATVSIKVGFTLSPTDQYLWQFTTFYPAQGFIRLVNRTGAPATVSIWGLARDGSHSMGTATLTLAPYEARQYNDKDLANGSPAKGLTGALGPMLGFNSRDWTLVVHSNVDVDALCYVRTADGFLTSMHDRVKGDGVDWYVPIFNPSSNTAQVSHLLLVNPGPDRADVLITGVDDLGSTSSTASISLAPFASANIPASALEYGNSTYGVSGKLGTGIGKWRLHISSSANISVQSLLYDPKGYQTNLSTLADGTRANDGSMTLWYVPPASNTQQQGFVRLINPTAAAATVSIWGTDDDGVRSSGTATATIRAFGSLQLNSQDLENGSTDKGLTGMLGHGTGNWRLHVLSTAQLQLMSLIRTPDGFLTSVHDLVAPSGLSWRVPTVNPGSNHNQVSVMRVVNAGNSAAHLSITGVDEAGHGGPGGAATLMVAAGKAIEITSEELETGSPAKGLVGAIGSGTGKWTISITSDQPVQLMSLLKDPKGYLTNLSNNPKGISSRLSP